MLLQFKSSFCARPGIFQVANGFSD